MIDPAFWGPWGVPATALAYGDSGDGKTVDMGYTFHRNGAYVGSAKHLRSMSAVSGIPFSEFRCFEAVYVQHITALIPQLAAIGVLGIGVDDLTIIANATFMAYDAAAPVSQKGFKDGYFAYNKVKEDIMHMRNTAQACGVHLVWNAHKIGADTDNKGRYFKGGPEMPSRGLRKAVPVIADTTVGCEKDPQKLRGWKGCYVCDPDSAVFYQRDRFNVAPKKGPMNLAELWRTAGYLLPYPPELSWAAGSDLLGGEGSIIEMGAQALLDGAGWDDLTVAVVRKGREAQAIDPMIAWALRDINDRAAIRRARQNQALGLFGVQG